jgi:hypothetical protein
MTQWRTQGGKCQAAARTLPPSIEVLKNTDFVDTMISNLLRDFAFSQSQYLIPVDDSYIRRLKNKMKNLG